MADGTRRAKMPNEELQQTVRRLLENAKTFAEQELAPARKKATDYYLGEPFGNEREGRSQVVMTVVRDAVDAVMPGLMRVFFGPERVVEFAPRVTSADPAGILTAVGRAAQASEYVQKVFVEDNAGFLQTFNVLQDGLVRRLGVFKWGWVDGEPEAHCLENLSEEQAGQLADDPSVEITEAKENADGTWTIDCVVTPEGRPGVWALPPEEFLFDRGARTLDDAVVVAHKSRRTRSDLLALGIPEKELDEHAGATSALDGLDEIGRLEGLDRTAGPADDEAEGDESVELIDYTEAYIKIDADGDGRAELRQIRAIGPQFHIVGEPKAVSERPFALFAPKPLPHMINGQSLADLTMDLQLTTSSLMRGLLDSLALSIFPRTEYVEGQVSVADILNTEIGAPIRTRAPGMVREVSHDFKGREVLPVLDFFERIKERRTGQSDGASGLDVNALQSSTKSAVEAQTTAAQMQTELYARIFAEQTMKPLFRGLLRLLVAHQPKVGVQKLRGEWVEVDPAVWDATMPVEVNVALGVGSTEEKVGTLLGIAQKQEQIFATLGPANPLVTLGQYQYTLATIARLKGFKNTASFFNEVPPDWQPPAPPAPQPSPEQVLAQAQLQIEQMKTQRELAIKEAELQLKQDAQAKEHEREEMRLALDAQLRRYEIELKYGAQISNAQMAADTKATEALLDGHMEAARLAHEADQAARQQDHTEQMATREQDHAEHIAGREQDRADYEAEQAAQQAAAAPEAGGE